MAKILNLGDIHTPNTGGHNLFGAGLASASRTADLAGQLSNPHSGLIAAAGIGRAALVLPKPVASPIFLDTLVGYEAKHKITDYFTPIPSHNLYLCGGYIYNDYGAFSANGVDEYVGTYYHHPLPSWPATVAQGLACVGPEDNGARYPSSAFKCFSTSELNRMADMLADASCMTNVLTSDGGNYDAQTTANLCSSMTSQPTPPLTNIWSYTGSGQGYRLEDIALATCGCYTQVDYTMGGVTDDGACVAYGKTLKLPGAFFAIPVGEVGRTVYIPYRLVPSTDCTCYYRGGRNNVRMTYYDPGEASLPLAIYVIPVVGEWSNTWRKPISLDQTFLEPGRGHPVPKGARAYVEVPCPKVPSGDGSATGEAVEGVLDFPVPESRLVYICLWQDWKPTELSTLSSKWRAFVATHLKARLVGPNNLDTFICTRRPNNITFHTANIMRRVTREATLYIGSATI